MVKQPCLECGIPTENRWLCSYCADEVEWTEEVKEHYKNKRRLLNKKETQGENIW